MRKIKIRTKRFKNWKPQTAKLETAITGKGIRATETLIIKDHGPKAECKTLGTGEKWLDGKQYTSETGQVIKRPEYIIGDDSALKETPKRYSNTVPSIKPDAHKQ